MDHPIVSQSVWLEARQRLLTKEKELTQLRDQLSEQRRALPWVRIEKPYTFDGPSGKQTLLQLFDGRSQLVVYHLMFAPEWQTACKSCSFWADHFGGIAPHVQQRDVTLVAISRAPLAKLQSFKERMGWTFPWLSALETDFNQDFQVSFNPGQLSRGEAVYNYRKNASSMSDLPGVSVFVRDPAGSVFHTYSAFSRGIDALNATYQFLDLVPKGRDEAQTAPMSWVKLRDEYVR